LHLHLHFAFAFALAFALLTGAVAHSTIYIAPPPGPLSVFPGRGERGGRWPAAPAPAKPDRYGREFRDLTVTWPLSYRYLIP